MRPVQLQDIEWPSETTFSYTPFGDGISKGPPPSKIDMGVDGNLLSLTRYKNDEISYIEYIDDRGFISSRIYYNEGKTLFPRVSEFWWAMGFERDVDRREPLRHG